MSSPSIPSTKNQNSIPATLDPILAIGQTIELESWLKMVAYHSDSASAEDKSSLLELANNLPASDNGSAEVQGVIDEIKKFAQTKMYNPALSPKSQQALVSLVHNLTKKPKCARKLFSEG